MKHIDRETSKNLYIVGFMGVGKSTIGRLVARRLKMRFIDSDKAIEVKYGKPAGKLFEELGEDAFRDCEQDFVLNGHPQRGCIVSCGGGLIIADGMVELLQERGIVICLYARAQTIHERTKHRDTRPLLNVANPEERIHLLLEERLEKYLNSGTVIYTENRPKAEVAKHVIRLYMRQLNDD